MTRNRIQFQNGLCWGSFKQLYGTKRSLARRSSPGIGRGGSSALVAAGGAQLHPHASALPVLVRHRQTLLTAGTIFVATKLALRTWFRALYQLTQSKGGIS